LRRSGHGGQHGDMVPEGDTKALQQFAMYIGYARVSPDQNLTTQQQACSHSFGKLWRVDSFARFAGGVEVFELCGIPSAPRAYRCIVRTVVIIRALTTAAVDRAGGARNATG
jgi:hypothetical protein